MDRALFAAASGMAAQQQNLETIADNLANAGVVGFKGSAQSLCRARRRRRARRRNGRARERACSSRRASSRAAPAPFDLAIDGPGFFTLVDARGRRAYTRDGQFSRAADGTLRNARDARLAGVRIPADALSLTVERRRHRARDVRERHAHDRAHPLGGVPGARAAARDRRHVLRRRRRSREGRATSRRAATTDRSCDSGCSKSRTSRSSTR